MPRVLYALLLFLPLTVVAEVLHAPRLLVFALAAVALIPLAGLIGLATEHLAHHLGPRWGGLLNATFGNAAELIITIFAIQGGLITLVKASITGSIIGNTLLVFGAAVLAGGFKHGIQRFDTRETSLASAMMILALAGLYLPAVFALSLPAPYLVEELSIEVAAVMLLLYVAYLAYGLFGPTSLPDSEPDTVAVVVGPAGATGANPPPAPEEPTEAVWSRRRALITLSVATVATAYASEALVGTVEEVTRQVGWSEFFVGAIIVPIIGNVAEHFSAVQFAWRNRMDVALAIAAGSSTQIALLVAPLLVFLSIPLGHPMDLVFLPLELAVLGVSTAIFAYVCLDGESNWLEGLQLLAVYAIAAGAFFLLPLTAHG